MNYQILKNRLSNGEPYVLETALTRINYLADNLVITQEQAEELISLANQNASITKQTMDERLAELEKISAEHDNALIELASMIESGTEGV